MALSGDFPEATGSVLSLKGFLMRRHQWGNSVGKSLRKRLTGMVSGSATNLVLRLISWIVLMKLGRKISIRLLMK